MALGRKNLSIWDGDVIVDGATVEVRRESDGVLVSLYSDRDGTTPLGNPFLAADGADAGFFAAAGAYKITVTKGAFTRIWRYEPVGTAGEYDIGTSGASVPLLNAANTWSALQTFAAAVLVAATLGIASAAPTLSLNETDGGADAKEWRFAADGGVLRGRVLNDALDTAVDWLTVTRSGATISSIGFGATISPLTDDGGALGTASLKWSDFHLASGAVINFNAGDVLWTHSSNKLTQTGGGFAVSSVPAGVTALSISGVGNAALYIDYNGGGANYQDGSAHYFRSGSGSTTWALINAGTLTLTGGGASSYDQVILTNDASHSYQFGLGGTTSAQPDKFFIYNSSDGFILSSLYGSGNINLPKTTASTSTTTGALTIAGGIGVGGAGYFGGTVYFSGTVYGVNIDISADYWRSGSKVVGARKTGWTVPTGTLLRSGYTTYTDPLVSAGYVQAEVQAISTGLEKVSRTLAALITDLHSTAGHGLLGA